MKYLETGLVVTISLQPQSSLQILFSFSLDPYCIVKGKKKCTHKHTIVKAEPKNVHLLLKTISKLLHHHRGKHLAPTDQLATTKMRFSM